VTAAGVLVVGYGNPLRTDDGIGWRAVEAVAADPRLAGATAIAIHQLLPELALDVSQASLVVLVDARVGLVPGAVAVDLVEPAATGATAWSHHLTPAALGGMARELYGQVPAIFTVGVGVASMDAGDRPTTAVEAAIPLIVETVARLVAAHAPGTVAPERESIHA
jgi:hydrogenase maturation protease